MSSKRAISSSLLIGMIVIIIGLLIFSPLQFVGAQGTSTPRPTGTTTPNAVGTAKVGVNRGSISVGAGDVWSYQGQANEILNILVAADKPANEHDVETRKQLGLLDTLVTIYAPSGSILATNDDIIAGTITDSSLRHLVLPFAGVYRIEVRSFNDEYGGAFTLEIGSTVAQNSATVSVGDPSTGNSNLDGSSSDLSDQISDAQDVIDAIRDMLDEFSEETYPVIIYNTTSCAIVGSLGGVPFVVAPYGGTTIQISSGSHLMVGGGKDCTLIPKTHVIEQVFVIEIVWD